MKFRHNRINESMKERICLLLSILVLAGWNLSFRWPLNDGLVTSSFCESRWDHFHDGIDMVSNDEKVYPVQPGRLYYMWDRLLFPLEKYPGGGNYKVLSHGNNMFSLYMHLKDGLSRKKSYRENDALGVVGNTGHSFGSHLHFTLFNFKDMTSFNAMSLLPEMIDGKEPKVKGFYLKIKGKYIKLRDKSDIRLTQHYPPLLEIKDEIKGGERLGIYRLTVSHNGRVIQKETFSTISSSDKGMFVSGKKHNDLFDNKGYYRIEGVKYVSGMNKFVITAVDYAGNKKEESYTFNVTLDI